MSPIPIDVYIGEAHSPLTPNQPEWHAPLPQNRLEAAKPPSATSTVTLGTYFQAVSDFLLKNKMTALVQAVSRALKRRITPDEISGVAIRLIKHGALYHPCLVQVQSGTTTMPLILNGAVSAEGRKTLPVEFNCLQRLNQEFDRSFIPQVYVCGQSAAFSPHPVELFIGQWLNGYHEFHLTDDNGCKWRVWDADQGHWDLSQTQAQDFYYQATSILTYYYNPETFEGVLDWHHAAGDFVVKKKAEHLNVRLITVRRYSPMFQLDMDKNSALQTMLEALAVFLLNTSLRMRLDRLDGVGALAWADEAAVSAIWQGFIQGLTLAAAMREYADGFAQSIHQYLAGFNADDFYALGKDLLTRQAAKSEQTHLIHRHLADHAASLVTVIRDAVF